jgi:hypothetical protein
MTRKPEPMLWLNDARGVYIPRDFANCFIDRDKHVSGVRAELWTILEGGPDGPQGPDYWEVWQDVCDNATVTDENGVKYSLHQDGDLWLIPEGMEWSDQNQFFIWPEDEPLDPPGWEGGFADNH